MIRRLIYWDRKIPQLTRQFLVNDTSMGGSSGRYAYRQQQQRHYSSSSILWRMNHWQQKGIFYGVKEGICTYILRSRNPPIVDRIQMSGNRWFWWSGLLNTEGRVPRGFEKFFKDFKWPVRILPRERQTRDNNTPGGRLFEMHVVGEGKDIYYH
jgi:hypothetical protein